MNNRRIEKANNKHYVFFWKPDENFGELSNWWICDINIDGNTFSSVEQYMMYMKAKTFGDDEIVNQILKTTNNKVVKELGRKVKNYDDKVWSDVRYAVIKKAILAKIEQHPEIKKIIMSTPKDTIFAEASPFDKIWGIGISIDDSRRLDEKAQLMGINVNGIITITFAIGSALAALAGLFYLLKAPSISSTLGAMPGIKAFTAAVIGGIGSIPGAMLGGILLGMVECISYKITAIAPYTDAIEFSILIIILLVRPTGFLGKKRREKV